MKDAVLVVSIVESLYSFFNDTAHTSIYTLSLHDALPICSGRPGRRLWRKLPGADRGCFRHRDRKSTRLNSSHRCISYAVFCLKKKIINTFIFNTVSCISNLLSLTSLHILLAHTISP